MQRPNRNFVYTLAESARKTISEGYYTVDESKFPRRSLKAAIQGSKRIPVITEVKFRSPAEGSLREHDDVAEIARMYERGGAAGISVLTEPKHFEGRIEYLARVKASVSIPVLMKDIILDPVQIEAAQKIGADAILLMASIFKADLSELSLDAMTDLAHSKGLEVLLEAHTKDEYLTALDSSADVIGINNRDLETLQVSLDTSRTLLSQRKASKIVISESGLSKRSELLELQSLGADGFLVGSSLMKSKNIEGAVRELVGQSS
jgi:indole-3-glycerol phosphate synthase